jgi:hypothetical protein
MFPDEYIERQGELDQEMVKLIHREMDLSLKIRKMENDENFNSFE